MSDIYAGLLEYMQGLEIIDTHEHLLCEHDRLDRNVDVLTLLHLYEYVDLTSAGYQPREGENVFVNNLFMEDSIPIEERWKKVSGVIDNIKYGSYYRPTKIALKDLYGIDDLNDDTYMEATEKIRAANKKGLYKSILADKCNIKKSLVQNGRIEGQDPADIFIPLLANVDFYQFNGIEFIDAISEKHGVKVTDIESYLQCLNLEMEDARAKGAIGFKIAASPYVRPDQKQAAKDFKDRLKGEAATVVLKSTVLDHIMVKCAEFDWPVAVHCGVWWDYRTVDSKDMIDVVMAYPDVRFDLYHLGMPFVRDTIFIAKNFPNVFLNLCWTYLVSGKITQSAINEIIDTVPVNKVFGFGADSVWSIEGVYGHLVVARETIARALTERINDGLIDAEGAKHIIKLWMYDNPVNFYKLNV